MAKAKKLKSGSWRILVYSHTELVDGKPVRRYESFTSDDKKEVEFLAAQFAKEKKRKSRVLNWTVGEAIDGYIASKDGILSPTTIEGYKKIRKNSIQILMPISLRDLNKEIIQKTINQEAKKISTRTGQAAFS